MKRLLLAWLTCALVAMTAGSTLLLTHDNASADTLTVDTLVDENDGSCVDGDCSLRDAIALADPDDTIDFSVTGTITLGGTEIAFPNKDLTIEGPGADMLTIDGDDSSRIFNIVGGTPTVNISGLTFADGNASLTGGAIQASGTLNLSDLAFVSNSANHGGAIRITDGALNVARTVFSGNSAVFAGGAILSGVTTNIAASTFSGNSSGSSGGALQLSSATTRITSSTFVNNAGGGIGPVAVYTTGLGSTNITNSIFSGGGNDCLADSPATHSGSNNLSDFSCPGSIGPVSGLDATLSDNGGPTETHAIAFTSNAADTASSCTYPGTFTNTIFDPSTDQRGFPRPSGTGCDIGAFEFTHLIVDTTEDPGDGSCADGDCALRDAVALAPSGYTITFDLTYPATITLNGTQISFSKDLTIEGPGADMLTIDGDESSRIFNTTGSHTVSISGMTLSSGIGSINGGAIHSDGPTLNITDTVFFDNEAAHGGAIMVFSGIVNLAGSTFTSNESPAGAAVYIEEGTVNATATSFLNNIADVGGAIYSKGTLNVAGSTFAGNISGTGAGDGGGAIFTLNATTRIAASTFSENSGSGTILNRGSLTVTSSTFYASSGGGLISHLADSLNLTNTILNNASGPECGTIVGSPTGFNNRSDGTCPASLGEVDGFDATLADNGGPIQTHLIDGSSNAVDAASSCTYPGAFTDPIFDPTIDQRGLPRPSGAGCDIGAVEAFDFDPVVLPDGEVSDPYYQIIQTDGGIHLYTYEADGDLPDGMSLSSAGLLQGTPTESGDFDFVVTATDTTGFVGRFSYSLTIQPASPAATPTPSPTPTSPVGPAPSPTPSATPDGSTPGPTIDHGTATPTPTPEPTVDQPFWGDFNCDGDIDLDDALLILLFGADLYEPTGGVCPGLGDDFSGEAWGDVNCDGSVNILDALDVFWYLALGQTLTPLPSGCPSFE